MNNDARSAFLKEMGITEWSSREDNEVLTRAQEEAPVVTAVTRAITATIATATIASQQAPVSQVHESTPIEDKVPTGMWWFFGNAPQGDGQILFQNVIRALGLSADEWSWKSPADDLKGASEALSGLPVLAFVFGGQNAQKLTGERDPLPQLRETVLGFAEEGLEEIPVVATFDLNHLISRPQDKSLLWRDLILARSVLQNI